MRDNVIDPLPTDPPPAEPIPAPETEEPEEEPAPKPIQRLGLPRLRMSSYQPDPQILAEFGARCAGEMTQAKRG